MKIYELSESERILLSLVGETNLAKLEDNRHFCISLDK